MFKKFFFLFLCLFLIKHTIYAKDFNNELYLITNPYNGIQKIVKIDGTVLISTKNKENEWLSFIDDFTTKEHKLIKYQKGANKTELREVDSENTTEVLTYNVFYYDLNGEELYFLRDEHIYTDIYNDEFIFTTQENYEQDAYAINIKTKEKIEIPSYFNIEFKDNKYYISKSYSNKIAVYDDKMKFIEDIESTKEKNKLYDFHINNKVYNVVFDNNKYLLYEDGKDEPLLERETYIELLNENVKKIEEVIFATYDYRNNNTLAEFFNIDKTLFTSNNYNYSKKEFFDLNFGNYAIKNNDIFEFYNTSGEILDIHLPIKNMRFDTNSNIINYNIFPEKIINIKNSPFLIYKELEEKISETNEYIDESTLKKYYNFINLNENNISTNSEENNIEIPKGTNISYEFLNILNLNDLIDVDNSFLIVKETEDDNYKIFDLINGTFKKELDIKNATTFYVNKSVDNKVIYQISEDFNNSYLLDENFNVKFSNLTQCFDSQNNIKISYINNDNTFSEILDYDFNTLYKATASSIYDITFSEEQYYLCENSLENGKYNYTLLDKNYNEIFSNFKNYNYYYENYLVLIYDNITNIYDIKTLDLLKTINKELNINFYQTNNNKNYFSFSDYHTGKFGIIDKNFNIKIDNLKDICYLNDDCFNYRKGFKYGLMDYDGNVLIENSIFETINDDQYSEYFEYY